MESVGLILIFGFVILLLIWRLALLTSRQPSLRPIPAWSALPAQVGRAVESGGILHISMGTGGVGGTETLAGLAAVPVLDYLAERTAGCDEIPVVTVADPTMLGIALDGLRRAQSRYDGPDGRAMHQAQWLGSNSLSYAGGVAGLLQSRQVTGNAMIGFLGPETVLMTEAGRRVGSIQVGGAPEPASQAVLSLTTDHVLLGEDMFAGRAYLSGSRDAIATLLAQDTARWGLVVAMVLGSIIAALGAWR